MNTITHLITFFAKPLTAILIKEEWVSADSLTCRIDGVYYDVYFNEHGNIRLVLNADTGAEIAARSGWDLLREYDATVLELAFIEKFFDPRDVLGKHRHARVSRSKRELMGALEAVVARA